MGNDTSVSLLVKVSPPKTGGVKNEFAKRPIYAFKRDKHEASGQLFKP